MSERKLYAPLNFWYCQNPESSVPLISLQYHPVDIYVNFNPVNKCIRRGATWFAKIDASNLTDIVEIGTKLYLDNLIAYLETEKLDNNSIDFRPIVSFGRESVLSRTSLYLSLACLIWNAE